MPGSSRQAVALLVRMLAPYREGLSGLDRRIFVIAGVTLIAIASRMGLYTFLSLYFTRNVGLALSLVGSAYLLENVARGLVGPLAGAWSDRIGRKPVLIMSALFSAALMPMFLLVHEPWQLLLWAGVLGAAQSGAFPVTSALLLDLAPPEKRRAALGLNYTALSIGYTLGVAPAGFLLASGFGLLAGASAGGFLLIALILLFSLRDLPPPSAAAGVRGSMLRDISRAPRDRAFLLLASLGLVFPLGIGLIATVAPIYAADAGLGLTSIGLALAVNGPLLAIFAIPVATRLEGHGPYRHLPIAAIFLAASYVSFILSGGFGALIVASVLFTVGELIFSSALPAAVGALAPVHLRGAYQGAWALVHSFGFGGAVFLTGLIEMRAGWSTTWIVWTIATVLAAVGLALARPRFRQLADARADEEKRETQTLASPA